MRPGLPRRQTRCWRCRQWRWIPGAAQSPHICHFRHEFRLRTCFSLFCISFFYRNRLFILKVLWFVQVLKLVFSCWIWFFFVEIIKFINFIWIIRFVKSMDRCWRSLFSSRILCIVFGMFCVDVRLRRSSPKWSDKKEPIFWILLVRFLMFWPFFSTIGRNNEKKHLAS